MKTRDRFTAKEIREAGTLIHGRLPGEVVMPGPVKTKREDPERQLQRAVVKALDAAGVRFFHVPNQRRDPMEAIRLSAEGVKKGVADLFFPYALNGLPRMGVIELKSMTGSLSAEQREWRDYFKAIGYEWACLRSVESVVETLIFWRVPKAEKIRL